MAEYFLQSLEKTFTNHWEVEEARKKLNSKQQGTKKIEKFNIILNYLLYIVDLCDTSKCEFYEDTISPGVLDLGLVWGVGKE